MAVKIRLRRMGYKKNPIYRIIVADSRSQPTEIVGKIFKAAGIEK